MRIRLCYSFPALLIQSFPLSLRAKMGLIEARTLGVIGRKVFRKRVNCRIAEKIDDRNMWRFSAPPSFDCRRIISSEWPPRSKKLSLTST